jgi:malonyl-CoA O-methyltransferase
MERPPQQLNAQHVLRRFDRAASTFDQADYVHRHAFSGLSERLEPLRISPAWILDLGAATGAGSRALGKRYRKARIVSGDLSMEMLRRARNARGFLSKAREVRMDARQLPLQDGSIDLVVANMLLPWIDDLPGCLREVGRVLCKGGVFTFATLGSGSFEPLRQVEDGETRLNRFADMHDVGDALVQAGLADPVLDVDRLTITWPDIAAIRRDHVASGAGNTRRDRAATLTGRSRLKDALDTLRRDGGFAAEIELVYGHAWGTGPRPDAGEFRVDANAIGRRPGR